MPPRDFYANIFTEASSGLQPGWRARKPEPLLEIENPGGGLKSSILMGDKKGVVDSRQIVNRSRTHNVTRDYDGKAKSNSQHE
jgi:hypothetical protein